jgi:RNA polymerase sigma-70 factor, ECF subfamily
MMAYAQGVGTTQRDLPSRAWKGARRYLFRPTGMNGRESGLPVDATALLTAVSAKRDRAAFEILFIHFAPRIKSYLLRLGASPALADDLAQDAMLTIWRKASIFDPSKASASTWVFTVARNLRIDAIRREKRPEFDPHDPAFVPDQDMRADLRLVRDGEDAELRDALTKLSAEQAQVVRMSFFADKPHSEIAKELGLPLGTVKSRLRLAMARIKAALGGDA